MGGKKKQKKGKTVGVETPGVIQKKKNEFVDS